MNEELVSYKTAKLAIKKGFNGLCIEGYTKNKKLMTIDRSEESFFRGASRAFRNSDLKEYNKDCIGDWIAIYTAPTQSLVQRWLREKHNVLLFVNYYTFAVDGENGYYYHIGKIHSYYTGKSATYEECLEKGLQNALKLIK